MKTHVTDFLLLLSVVFGILFCCLKFWFFLELTVATLGGRVWLFFLSFCFFSHFFVDSANASEWSWKEINVAAGGDTIFFRFELFEEGDLGVTLFGRSNISRSSVAWSVCGDLVSVALVAAPFAVVVLFVGLPRTCKK